MTTLKKDSSLSGWQRVGLLLLYTYIFGVLFWLIYLANTEGFKAYPTEKSLNDRWAVQYINTVKSKLGEAILKEEDWGVDAMGRPYVGQFADGNSELIINDIRKKYKNKITQGEIEFNDLGYEEAKKDLPLKQALFILFPLGLFLLVPLSIFIGFTVIRYLFNWISEGFKSN